MYIYKVWQDYNNGYDTYDSAIVCAENEEEAKRVMPSVDLVKCKLIGKALNSIKIIQRRIKSQTN